MEHQYTSPDAPVKNPDDDIPERFINGCDGDIREARRRWDITRKWRTDEVIITLNNFVPPLLFVLTTFIQNIDSILIQEQPNFETIKVNK